MRWDGRQVRTIEVVPPTSVLTHYGKRRADGSFDFQEQPKWRPQRFEPWVEIDISMIEGRVDVETASRYVRRMPVPKKEQKREAIRYFLAGDLFAHSYHVCRTPTAGIPPHVSVYGDMREIEAMCEDKERSLTAPDAHRTWWRNQARVTLESLEIERKGRDDQDS